MQPESTEETSYTNIAEGAERLIDLLLNAKYTEVYESIASGTSTPRSINVAEQKLESARKALFNYIIDAAKRAPERAVEQATEETSVSWDQVRAAWDEMFRVLPNHYASASSMRQSLKTIRYFVVQEHRDASVK